MNRPPIPKSSLKKELKAWMEEVNLKTLWDISSWHRDNWVGWKTPNVLVECLPDYAMLLQMLHGAAPIHARREDTRGWGTQQTVYSVSQSYAKISKRPHLPPNPTAWKGIWNFPTIPKMDFFFWLLCHQKILTEDRLLKRGFHSPSRCVLCKEYSEIVVHISLD